MRRRIFEGLYRILFLVFLLQGNISAQDIPDKPYPPRLVNDFAGILSRNEVTALEDKLVAFNDTTSTQIAIVIVNDLGGYDKSDYAFRLAEKWGIGQKGLDNGVLILVKPKTSTSSGQVFIAPGYGLEGVITDLTCGEIIDYEMIPEFRNNNYYKGLDKATSVLMSLASEEFTDEQYGKKIKGDFSIIFPFVIFVIVLIIILGRRNMGGRNQKHISTGGLPMWMILAMMNSRGSKHSGSWGGFSGGRGGFGGFGGGSFGGGGAGGSW